MTKNITGLAGAHEYLIELMGQRKYNNRITQSDVNFALDAAGRAFKISRRGNDHVRRVKIVHVDQCWNTDHDLLSRDVVFGSVASMEINKERLDKHSSGSDYDPLHGTACISAIQLNLGRDGGELCDREKNLWNLADFTEVVLVPVRNDLAKITSKDEAHALKYFMKQNGFTPELANYFIENVANPAGKDAKNVAEAKKYAEEAVSVYKASQSITGALDEIIQLKKSGVLEHGDVVVITIQTELHGQETHALPIIHNPWIEEKVQELTNEHGLSVIIPAGNSGIDLGSKYYPRFGKATTSGMESEERKLFENRGVSCGAILVGADSENKHSKTVNHGPCVDVYGRCAVTVPDPATLPISNDLYGHWSQSSIASMVAAAVIGTVQQIRFATLDEKISPLKPYEARAHIRQWKHLEASDTPCIDDMMGDPPDICAWLRGTVI